MAVTGTSTRIDHAKDVAAQPAPRPSASGITAEATKPGLLRNVRSAMRMSSINRSTDGQPQARARDVLLDQCRIPERAPCGKACFFRRQAGFFLLGRLKIQIGSELTLEILFELLSFPPAHIDFNLPRPAT